MTFYKIGSIVKMNRNEATERQLRGWFSADIIDEFEDRLGVILDTPGAVGYRVIYPDGTMLLFVSEELTLIE